MIKFGADNQKWWAMEISQLKMDKVWEHKLVHFADAEEEAAQPEILREERNF